MPPRSSSPDPVRSFFKRAAHGAKKLLKPGDQTTGSRAPSPSPQMQPGDPGLLLQLPGQSQQPAASPQLVPDHGQPAPVLAPLPLATTSNQPVSVDSSLTVAAKKAGADAWSGLRVALQLLKESSDVFPPVKSAVAGFLGVVDIFEASNLVPHALTGYSFIFSSVESRAEQERLR